MNAKSENFIKLLPSLAKQYIDDCLSHTKEVVSGSGKIVIVQDRHIPTIAYFLHIWLERNFNESISRTTYYEWLNSKDEVKTNTIKNIDDTFKSLAGDIVANEGKGIFYAKNKLGWSDRIESKNENTNIEIKAEFNSLQKNEDTK